MASYCHPCDRSFVNQSALQQHLNSSIHAPRTFSDQHVPEQRLSPSVHAPVCNECDRKFNNQQALNQHLNSLGHNKPIPSFGLINRELRSTSSFPAVAPPEKGLVWSRSEGIHWEVGYHPRDRYALSRRGNRERDLLRKACEDDDTTLLDEAISMTAAGDLEDF
ncbi:hypothetical protein V493_02051 [Pseudogymnoascus sp. VKM F-4281 (FW-2241)]|nr:hypothetical protein V493_02051 [Pseudogymnoascus sp. VKM F-4281 (FW-2241)]